MDTQVLVAGAGPTGLTLAIELARRGVAVRIVDRDPNPFTGSRGDGLQPRTLEVFEDLGILDRVKEESMLPAVIRAYLDGEFAMERRMAEEEEPTADVPYPNAWILPQARTEQLLADRLAELGVQVERGTELSGFTQDDDGVTATVGGEPVRARYLVGADGGSSVCAARWASRSPASRTRRSACCWATCTPTSSTTPTVTGSPARAARWTASC